MLHEMLPYDRGLYLNGKCLICGRRIGPWAAGARVAHGRKHVREGLVYEAPTSFWIKDRPEVTSFVRVAP